MTTPSYLLGCYEDVAEISEAMSKAAVVGAWHEVERLREISRCTIDEVRVVACQVSLSRQDQYAKLAVMQRIIRDDAKIRELAHPQQSELAKWFAHPDQPPGNGDTLQ